MTRPLRCLLLFLLLTRALMAQPDPATTFDTSAPPDRATLLRKLSALPCGIQNTDSKPLILQKLKTYLDRYVPDTTTYAEEHYAKAAVMQALRSVQTGGYGIGAVLVDGRGRVLHGAHNAQLQRGRSDLHAEMNLLNEFESLPQFAKYRGRLNFTGEGNTIYAEPLTLYTSAEPCPMCFVRVAIVGVETRYVTAGPDDGMNARAQCLPPFWYQLSQKHKVQPAQSSAVLGQLAHCLFYSFLL